MYIIYIYIYISYDPLQNILQRFAGNTRSPLASSLLMSASSEADTGKIALRPHNPGSSISLMSEPTIACEIYGQRASNASVHTYILMLRAESHPPSFPLQQLDTLFGTCYPDHQMDSVTIFPAESITRSACAMRGERGGEFVHIGSYRSIPGCWE